MSGEKAARKSPRKKNRARRFQTIQASQPPSGKRQVCSMNAAAQTRHAAPKRAQSHPPGEAKGSETPPKKKLFFFSGGAPPASLRPRAGGPGLAKPRSFESVGCAA